MHRHALRLNAFYNKQLKFGLFAKPSQIVKKQWNGFPESPTLST